jgi:hypothetical protein
MLRSEGPDVEPPPGTLSAPFHPGPEVPVPASDTVQRLAVALLLALLGTTAACGSDTKPASADSRATPALGTCRTITPKQTEQPSNSSPPGACSRKHTAETFAVGTFPAELATASYTDPRLGRYIYRTCGPAFVRFLGGDESIAQRSLFSWAWFRPSKAAWQQKVRWYRCDVVGGPSAATSYRSLPRTAKGFLSAAPPEAWMMCALGERMAGSKKVPCTQQHTWRAVTTIKLGEPADPYPGDRLAQIRSQQFCSDSIGAWLNYPTTDYDYGVTVFHAAEWKAGNRRSICWARTDR